MATVRDIVGLARRQLTDTGDRPYWTDNELGTLCVQGVSDLWRNIINIDEDYFLEIREDVEGAGLALEPGSNDVVGVPENFHKLVQLEPLDNTLDLTIGTVQRWSEADFIADRARDPADPFGSPAPLSVFVTGSHPNVNIKVYPTVTSRLPLRMAYIKSVERDLIDPNDGVNEGDTGRAVIWNDTFDPDEPQRDTFYRVAGFRIPRSDSGQLIFGATDGPGLSISQTFQWAGLGDIQTSLEGDVPDEDNSFNITMPYKSIHGTITDTGTISLGRTPSNELLISVDSGLAAANVFPIEPLTIHRLTRKFGVDIVKVLLDEDVPLPGDPTRALVSWTIAYALAKQSENKVPEVTWLQAYKSEKDNITNALTGRISEPITVADVSLVFDGANDDSAFILPFVG